MKISFSVASIVLGFLPAMASAATRYMAPVDSNVISIVTKAEGGGIKLKEVKGFDKHGESRIVQPGNKYFFDFKKTKVKFIDLPDELKERLTIYLYSEVETGDELASFSGDELDALATSGALFARAGQANEVRVEISIPGSTERPVKFKAYGGEDSQAEGVDAQDAEAVTVCDDPVFYESAYLEPIRGSEQDGNPYYVIEQNMNSMNSGPRIRLYKSDNDSSPKDVLQVGRNAVVFIKNVHPTYSKVAVKRTFKDYHLEDQSNFKTLLTGGISAAGKQESEDPEEGAKVSLKGAEAEKSLMDQAGKKLSEDLQRLLDDIKQRLPSMETFNWALAKTKENIALCFGDPDLKHASADKLQQVLKAALMSEEWVRKIYRQMADIERYHVYRTVPFSIRNADVMILTMYYYTENQQVAVDSSSFPISVSGGFKIDFSTGVIFSKLVNQRFAIMDADPEIREETDESGNVITEEIQRKQIIEEVPDKHNFGIAVLAHCYPRLSQWFSVAFTGGFMLQNDEAVQFPVGASFLIGKRPRLVLSVGGIFGSVESLSNRYQLNTPVDATKLNSLSAEQLTTAAVRRSWFIGISYNFGGVRIGN